jgi:hypothetical protein
VPSKEGIRRMLIILIIRLMTKRWLSSGDYMEFCQYQKRSCNKNLTVADAGIYDGIRVGEDLTIERSQTERSQS